MRHAPPDQAGAIDMPRELPELDQVVSKLEAALKHLDHRFDALVMRFNDVENQIIQLKIATDQRLDVVDHRLDGVEKRLEKVGHRLGGVEQKLDRIERQGATTQISLEAILKKLSA